MPEPAQTPLLRQGRALLEALGHAPAAGDDGALAALCATLETHVAQVADRRAEPVRALHHFACTGGTLIAKALASMPNTLVMSEIDPLSMMHMGRDQRPFGPTDLIPDLYHSPRLSGHDAILAAFAGTLGATYADLTRRGLHMVLRGHAHSQFCIHLDRKARPDLHRIVTDIMTPLGVPVLGLVTVRHPMESFLSLSRNEWLHFRPATLAEYCVRYLDFLDVHAALPLMRYEDFLDDPAHWAAWMCDRLALPFEPQFEVMLPLARMSGDSGRSSNVIGPRPRRPVPAELAAEAAQSDSYAALCARLGYDP